MKTKAIHKGKAAASKTAKTGDPLKDRTKAIADENVCKESETVVSKCICCCEEVCC